MTIGQRHTTSTASLAEEKAIGKRRGDRECTEKMIRTTIGRRTFATARSVRANAVQPVPQAEPLAVPPTGPPATQQPVIQPVVQSPTVQQIRVKRSIGGLRGGYEPTR